MRFAARRHVGDILATWRPFVAAVRPERVDIAWGNAGIVDQHVEAGDPRRQGSGRRRHTVVAGDVEREPFHVEPFIAQRLCRRLPALGIAGAEPDIEPHGSKAAIYLEQPGANTRVRSWCPTPGAQYGLLVTHNEAISIADFFTVRSKKGKVQYRPTCHYAYHPSNDAMLSLDEMFGAAGKPQPVHHVLDENELVDGVDELGVLLYGHDKNAYWYGSQLSLAEARKLAPYQNATGMTVS